MLGTVQSCTCMVKSLMRLVSYIGLVVLILWASGLGNESHVSGNALHRIGNGPHRLGTIMGPIGNEPTGFHIEPRRFRNWPHGLGNGSYRLGNEPTGFHIEPGGFQNWPHGLGNGSYWLGNEPTGFHIEPRGFRNWPHGLGHGHGPHRLGNAPQEVGYYINKQNTKNYLIVLLFKKLVYGHNSKNIFKVCMFLKKNHIFLQ